jgi:hypothetical protein
VSDAYQFRFDGAGIVTVVAPQGFHRGTWKKWECVPKLYPTRANVAFVAVLAAREISNLHRFSGDRGFESHPRLQHSI